MVSIWSIVFMIVSGLICVALPFGGMAWLLTRRLPDGTRRHVRLWRPFLCGVLAFFVSQVITRLPLMALVVPRLPAPLSDFLLSGPVASYTAGLFEETGRLVVMLILLKGFYRLVDGVAFGLGHGGLEAVLLVGLTMLNNLVIAVLINLGQWPTIAATMPPEAAAQVRSALVDTAPSQFLLAGIERIASDTVHIGCSLIIVWGIYRARRLLAWLAAVLLHGTMNLVAVLLLGVVAAVWVEVALLVIAGLVIIGIVRARRAFAPGLLPPAVPAVPAS